MEEGGRAGLNFVRTAVLRSGANGTEGTEEEVERIEHHAPGDGNPPSALERERELLAKREHASLYDQLKSQREEQQEEWQRQRAAQDLPPELDEDELAYLREQQEKQHAKAMQNKLEEETQMAAFGNGDERRLRLTKNDDSEASDDLAETRADVKKTPPETFDLRAATQAPKRIKLKTGYRDLLLEGLKPLDAEALRLGMSASSTSTTKTSVSKRKAAAEKARLQTEKLLHASFDERGRARSGAFFDEFRDLDAMFTYFTWLRDRFPDHVSLGQIGTSAQGRPIVALRLAVSTQANANPNVVILGTEHGREWMVPMALAEAARLLLVDADEMPPLSSEEQQEAAFLRAPSLLKVVNIWLVPILNPDGYAHTFSARPDSELEEEKQKRFWRKNRQKNADGSIGIDLNRNWGSDGFTWGHGQTWTESEVYMGASPFEAAETRAFRDWIFGASESADALANDARVRRALARKRRLATPVSGLLAVHCCIGGVLQPRNYCAVQPHVERTHASVGRQLCQQMNAIGHGEYSFKPRRKTLEISSSGISIDWAFYDALIPYPLMIETSSSKAFIEARRQAKLAGETIGFGNDDDDDAGASGGGGGSIAQQRKEKLRAKMAADAGSDIRPVGAEMAVAILSHAGLVAGAMRLVSSRGPERDVELSPWGFLDVRNTTESDLYKCKVPGRPDLVPADPCAKNKLKPWIKCNKKSSRSKRKKT
ncbi:Carboxypeptidase A4 [Hondaea fermentalgiana]|uniref:Carboxypeptidase A4 n=1 Tax=Hondaea fermentalgiana TaxID=2315210 RepID=A0A2R5GDV0_9STRA|nr:Carboxypeptidase A4 [Hondaea fermentalgiana]|eukprot:GBG29106.1 Carboxypeptidase A4 [Hondaea fermentalgiana]